jgi:hypothetical protein
MPAPRHRRVHGHSPWDTPGRVDLRLEVPTWTTDALCAEIGVEAYFNNYVRAKASCLTCPVINECLEWALTFDDQADQHGVFGGTSPSQRKKLREQRIKEAA